MNQHFHFAVLLMYRYMYMEQLFFIILLIELALTFEKYNLQWAYFKRVRALLSIFLGNVCKCRFTKTEKLWTLQQCPNSILLTASPLSLDTWRLSSISHLFPRIIFSTSSFACCNQWQTLVSKQEIHWSQYHQCQDQNKGPRWVSIKKRWSFKLVDSHTRGHERIKLFFFYCEM